MRLSKRLFFFYFLFFSLFLLLFVRLFQLQIKEGSKNRKISEGNRLSIKPIPAPRGIIYDRHDKALVRNVPIYRKLKTQNSKLKSEEDYEIISREEVLRLEAEGKTEGLRVDIGREYLSGESLAHVLGYLGEVNEEEVKNGKYKMGDLVGRMGAEEEYDGILRGKDGGELIEVDVNGQKVREMGKIEPKPGQDIYLSIDGELSRVAYEALEGRPGAVVVTEAKMGKILVLVSSPSFDPNLFTNPIVSTSVQPGGVNTFDKTSVSSVEPLRIDAEQRRSINTILSDPGRPMFNRAISGVYPPGSTFKIITAATGLETGKINKNSQIEDVGEIIIGPYRFPNWYFAQYGKKEGNLNIIRALARSNDIFFYKVGEMVGIDSLGSMARKFGLSGTLGIDLPGEVKGIIPTSSWKEKVIGEKWYLGDTYHLAIGQGYILLTPLQVNFATSVIANGEKLCPPRITKNTPKENCQEIGLKEETINLIKEGMRQACSPGGTGWPLFDFTVKDKKIETACKTGTAEFGPSTSSGQVRTHAWFTVFAPVEEPEIVVTVLVEGGGEGSNVAAPIAKKVLQEYFRNR